MTEKLMTWAEMFPEGRTIFYEGDDPDGFIAEIKAKFGFDPSQSNSINGFWALMIENRDHWSEDCGYCFLCPAEFLDEIYGSGKYPMGS